ncbi:MAG: cation:proton antiporter [Bacteriovoracaceae bacterium]
MHLKQDLLYLTLFTLIQVLPKIFQRFKIPSGITALFIGAFAIIFQPQLIDDSLIKFLSQIGITSLFVFAGLEVDFKELYKDRVYLIKYLLSSILIIGVICSTIYYFFKVPLQESFILALGIFTPSAGFIINSIHSFELSSNQEYWVKSKAISKEIVAIFLLFIALQANDIKMLLLSLSFFVVLFFLLPYLFRFFFRYISPYAPDSELPFLVVLSLLAGVLSKELGAYYLVGAFAVGIVASQFKNKILKKDQEAIFSSLENFFNIFLPFYFFYAGLKIIVSDISLKAVLVAICFSLIFIPVRVFLIRIFLGGLQQKRKESTFNISLSLMPTLVFGLVIMSILKERAILPSYLIYALIIYTIITSLLPSIVFSFRNKEE